jgi:hypothetical protein
VLRGTLRWRARLPLGAAGSVEWCALEEGRTAEETDAEGNQLQGYRLLELARAALKRPWKEGVAVLGPYGEVRLARLNPKESATYVWADEAAEAVLRGCGGEVWGLVRKDGAAEQPLALLSPAWLLRRAALMHLVPGSPRTPLE